ncbi:BrnA antitoxin family protein [Iodobacter fluviatilis]|uniref:Toxin-antitoxin system, antitoxin component n=1 Tax=Iodobacter fluviatilis TaxID=537 RepID=A0A7G3GFQ1_9NEIS|nr:BrnA antitoxin family protein [Iodobacter fluviatilis]QBC45974.1 toxin-antitoxin system, antitoxin component [Iodobacter fluviatilis]QBC45982.1 toxin-antitoxin system, antitoxin component [Iodobacter fluviatilis]
MSMVRHEQGKLPALTAQRRAELEALAKMPDASIDYSDIPPLTDAFWQNAVSNPFYKPTKTHATVRLDSDVMAWLKSQGKGYQTRLNAILRKAMLEDIDKAHG